MGKAMAATVRVPLQGLRMEQGLDLVDPAVGLGFARSPLRG